MKSCVKWNGNAFLAHHLALDDNTFPFLSIVEIKHFFLKRLILIASLETICGHKPLTPIATKKKGIPSCVKGCIYMI